MERWTRYAQSLFKLPHLSKSRSFRYGLTKPTTRPECPQIAILNLSRRNSRWPTTHGSRFRSLSRYPHFQWVQSLKQDARPIRSDTLHAATATAIHHAAVQTPSETAHGVTAMAIQREAVQILSGTPRYVTVMEIRPEVARTHLETARGAITMATQHAEAQTPSGTAPTATATATPLVAARTHSET
jgi:hypothetical protein